MHHDLSPAGRDLYERCMRVVRTARAIVPEQRRDDWTREWSGELWYRASLLDRSRPIDRQLASRLILRTLGAFPHAFWALTDELRLDPMLQDLKYALRGMITRPAFTALVIATLALGIGANSAMFSIVNSVLIKPLPYDRPDELVYMYGSFKLSDRASVSPPDYLDYRARNSVFSSLGARTIFGNAVSERRRRAGTRAIVHCELELLRHARRHTIPGPSVPAGGGEWGARRGDHLLWLVAATIRRRRVNDRQDDLDQWTATHGCRHHATVARSHDGRARVATHPVQHGRDVRAALSLPPPRGTVAARRLHRAGAATHGRHRTNPGSIVSGERRLAPRAGALS